jgi:NADP-dependent 3-hydroxy acid dehydrogenase YdfG
VNDTTSTPDVAIITGAGSGVGRATAISLARRGWRLALFGRTKASLDETARLCDAGERMRLGIVDVGDADQVNRAVAEVITAWSTVSVLVNAAGTNVQKRSLDDLSLSHYHDMIDTNLHGSFHAARAVLPSMRAAGRGTIVNVVSIAAKRATLLAGAGYVISKFGQAGLTQAINVEENRHGIRACAIFPGDIDTPLLDQRPEPPTPVARAAMLTAQDVADCILLAIDLPSRAVVDELVVRPRVPG